MLIHTEDWINMKSGGTLPVIRGAHSFIPMFFGLCLPYLHSF